MIYYFVTFHDKTLLIHMGGLGDVCLSESAFLSLSRHYGTGIVACGYPRVLGLFNEYFSEINDIGSRQCLYLFSEVPSSPRWQRIILIGKDTDGSLRTHLQRLSSEPVVFIDMYPDLNGPADTACPRHTEDYQLFQCGMHGIEPVKKEVIPLPSGRLMLYPEKAFQKTKWPAGAFLDLYGLFSSKRVPAIVLGSPGLTLDNCKTVFIETLSGIKDFFREGGLFVSNDSGMAHLAGAMGLYTITIFTDADPASWRPRGRNLSLRVGKDNTDTLAVAARIGELLGVE